MTPLIINVRIYAVCEVVWCWGVFRVCYNTSSD